MAFTHRNRNRHGIFALLALVEHFGVYQFVRNNVRYCGNPIFHVMFHFLIVLWPAINESETTLFLFVALI